MNIRDIAKLAGVSVSTVSKVMNQKDASISQETRKKVLTIAKEYNYTPYSSYLPSTSKSFIIGVLFRSNQNISKLLSGIMDTAKEQGYQILLAYSNDNTEEELKSLTSFSKNKIDALLWETVSEASLNYTAELKKNDIPYLIFNSEMEDAENIDYHRFGYEATKTLIEAKHQDIGCLLLRGSRTDSFYEGYKKCLFDFHIPFREELVFDSGQINSLLQKIGNQSITATVCSHFSIASELYAGSLKHHYKVPWNFSIVSLKDDFRSETPFPDISSYAISRFDFGKYLCKKIISIIEKKSSDKLSFASKPELSSRVTVDIPPFMHTKRVLTIGSINLDVYLKVPHLPSTGSAVLTSQSSLYAGGKATNEAVGAAKLGHRTAIIGAVGNSTEADIIFEALHQQGIHMDGIKRVSDYSTAKAYIFVEPKGDSMITVLSGANEALSSQDLEEKEHLFENTAFCLINSEIPMSTVETACHLTRKHGGKTILKPSTTNYLSPDLLAMVDILILNATELSAIYPGEESIEDKAAFFHKSGPRIVIVTLGAQGCYALTEEMSEYFPAKNFSSIDKTGAGDAFISAFASYLLYGYSIRQAIHIAQYAAGFCITREGVVPSLVDKNTLESYINQMEPELLEKRK